MSIQNILVDNNLTLFCKNLAISNELSIKGHLLIFDRIDQSFSVSTYDDIDNLVNANVTTVNAHIVLVGDEIILSLNGIGPYTSPGVFNYFGFQLPAAFFPNQINQAVYIAVVNGIVVTTLFEIEASGRCKIFKDLQKDNFALNDTFDSIQQSVLYCNTD